MISVRERRWAWLSAILLAVLTPFLLFPDGWRTVALGGLPLIWFGNRIVTGHFIRRTPFDAAVLGLLIMVLISLPVTYDLSLSLPKIASVLLGVSAFYVVANFAATSPQLRQTIIALVIAMFLFAGLVLVGTNWVSKVPVLQQVGLLLPGLVRGLPGAAAGFHPAEVAGTIIWIVFIPAALVVGLWPRWCSWSMLAALAGLALLTSVLSLTLLLTQSRSAWLGATVGAAVILWLLGRWGRILLGIGLVLVLVGIVLLSSRQLLPSETASVSDVELIAMLNTGLADRMEIWSRAVYGLQDFPLTGMGLGMFRYMMPTWYPLFTVRAEPDVGHAHNEWLQTGVDLGLPGLVAFITLQFLTLWLAYRIFHSEAPREIRWLMAGILAGLIAHGVYGVTDAVALGAKPGIFWWWLLGVVAATWRVFNPVRS